ncbi:MAG: DUF2461 domain-containing protein [Bacteroidia bacterium]|nr:DUF2461 domain-containing protein [Bacteroidia bacterium]
MDSLSLIEKEAFSFLRSLSRNNNRDWFAKHKDKYLAVRANIEQFAEALLLEMNSHDQIETPSGKKALFRIYKDVRFSNDKTPYNTHWSGAFRRATKSRRGGYYFHLKPGNSFLACGFWGPEPADLQRIRQDIDLNFAEWRKVLKNKTILNTFGKMKGETVKSAPRGYAKDHPAIELLRYKQFYFQHDFTDKEVLSPGFVKKMSETYKRVRPFFDHMSEVLTTDANGVSVL